jgi:hypothetical protein
VRHPGEVKLRVPILCIALLVATTAAGCADDPWFTGTLVNDTGNPVLVLESCPTCTAANDYPVPGWKFDRDPLATLAPGATKPEPLLGKTGGNLPCLVITPGGAPVACLLNRFRKIPDDKRVLVSSGLPPERCNGRI